MKTEHATCSSSYMAFARLGHCQWAAVSKVCKLFSTVCTVHLYSAGGVFPVHPVSAPLSHRTQATPVFGRIHRAVLGLRRGLREPPEHLVYLLLHSRWILVTPVFRRPQSFKGSPLLVFTNQRNRTSIVNSFTITGESEKHQNTGHHRHRSQCLLNLTTNSLHLWVKKHIL